jgi:hypothetical protein
MKELVVFSYNEIKIVDTPGLQDSDGAESDQENLKKII